MVAFSVQMPVLTTLPLFLAILLHTHAAVYAHRPLLPIAGTGLIRPKRIEGLLGRAVRELFCDPGFGLCDDGSGTESGQLESLHPFMILAGCCPDGDECCTFGGCCPSGDYAHVHYKKSQNCVTDSEGNEGCCPDGEMCEGGGGVITIGGGGGGKTTHKNPPPPPKTTTHKNPPPPPKTTTHTDPPPPPTTTTTIYVRILAATHEATTSPAGETLHRIALLRCHVLTVKAATSATNSPETTTAPTPTPSGLSAPPSPSPGAENVYTSVDNTDITWEGAWVTTTSACNATSSAKRCAGDSSLDATGTMTYSFTGYSIAMSFASSNLAYGVQINEKSWSFSAADAFNCTYGIVYNVEFQEVQTINVQVNIDSTSSDRRSISGATLEERADAPWHLDVNDFVVQVADTSSSSSGGSSTSTGGLPTTSSAANAGSALRVPIKHGAFLMAYLACMAGFTPAILL
ncbi:hypothetical protein GGX14DRAFT_623266 [Mycena pura]|uniref:GPI anchored protein n=1 Tax=Mycena pura TaxID=153505 RepID=A0AAD6YBC6_9AGAR|nr:hypothetical protein GGX14DRAFT_623266 [Mycena pura]